MTQRGIGDQLCSLPKLVGLLEPVIIIPYRYVAAICLPVPLEPAALAGGYNSPVHRRLSDRQVPAHPFLCLVTVTCYLLRLETRRQAGRASDPGDDGRDKDGIDAIVDKSSQNHVDVGSVLTLVREADESATLG